MNRIVKIGVDVHSTNYTFMVLKEDSFLFVSHLIRRGTKKLSSFYFTGTHFKFLVLPHGKMIRILLLQFIKEHIHRILECLIVLPYLHGIQHLQKHGEVLFLLRCLVMDVADQGTVQQFFRL